MADLQPIRMSTGAPKETLIPNPTVKEIGGLAVRSSIDVCKGCRVCFKSFIKMIAQNRAAVGIVIALPILAMSAFLIYIETSLAYIIQQLPALRNVPYFTEYKLVIFSPMYTLAAITYGFGLLAIIAIKCEFQNLLIFSAFVYRGIAHWVLLSIFLLIIPIAGYLPLYIIWQITSWSLFPALLWLFTASVMTGHSDLITEGIEQRNRLARQVDNVMV
jgi:hypothetical protein